MVVQLYTQGERLPNEEILSAAPINGDLIVLSDDRGKKHVRLADLIEYGLGCRRPMLPPLFDPQLVKMAEGDKGFVLRGWQVNTLGGVAREYAQEWWVRPTPLVSTA